jgi:hypothetical protein
MSQTVEKLQRGDVVAALRDIYTVGGPVRKGTIGVVFEEAGYYDIDSGAWVRWFTGQATETFDGDAVRPEDYDA